MLYRFACLLPSLSLCCSLLTLVKLSWAVLHACKTTCGQLLKNSLNRSNVFVFSMSSVEIYKYSWFMILHVLFIQVPQLVGVCKKIDSHKNRDSHLLRFKINLKCSKIEFIILFFNPLAVSFYFETTRESGRNGGGKRNSTGPVLVEGKDLDSFWFLPKGSFSHLQIEAEIMNQIVLNRKLILNRIVAPKIGIEQNREIVEDSHP